MNRAQILQSVLGGQLLLDEPMARHTTLKVGGPARGSWAASDVEPLVRALTACTEYDMPYLFVGHGSNLLMSDRDYGNIGPLVTQVRVFAARRDRIVGPDWMEFSYRDSCLRRPAEQGAPGGRTVILTCHSDLESPLTP